MAFASQRGSVRLLACQVVAAITALALATAGCSYHSTYVAPVDGRARVVWGANDSPSVELSGAPLSSDCGEELRRITDRSRLPLAHGHVDLPAPRAYERPSADGYWTPRYYGSPIIVVNPGFAPPLFRPPLFLPNLVSPVGVPTGGLGAVGRVGSGSVGGGSSGGGGGKDLGALVLVLLIISVSVLPAVALGLGASMPESASKTASAMDLANAYNDLARTYGSPCSPLAQEPY